ncbi:TonB family protein, partial [bacterium]|nr:TonB family protein [bacterium]
SEGRVANATVVKGAYNELLNNAAVDAAKQWVFKPALARGKKPVKSWTTHEFTFKLK